jgi:hypothetical protein
MIVDFDKSFGKSLGKIKDQSVLKRIESVIIKLESAERIEDLSNTKSSKGILHITESKLGTIELALKKLMSID